MAGGGGVRSGLDVDEREKRNGYQGIIGNGEEEGRQYERSVWVWAKEESGLERLMSPGPDQDL